MNRKQGISSSSTWFPSPKCLSFHIFLPIQLQDTGSRKGKWNCRKHRLLRCSHFLLFWFPRKQKTEVMIDWVHFVSRILELKGTSSHQLGANSPFWFPFMCDPYSSHSSILWVQIPLMWLFFPPFCKEPFSMKLKLATLQAQLRSSIPDSYLCSRNPAEAYLCCLGLTMTQWSRPITLLSPVLLPFSQSCLLSRKKAANHLNVSHQIEEITQPTTSKIEIIQFEII